MLYRSYDAITGETDWFDDGEPEPEPSKPNSLDVDEERNRRLLAPFEFQGNMFSRDPVSVQRIMGCVMLAELAAKRGVDPVGDYFWNGEDDPFSWIDVDNNLVPMDIATVIAFGVEAASVESRLIKAARVLKNMSEVPDDYTDDKWWPSAKL